MLKFLKKCEKWLKLTSMYIRRILLAKNKFKTGPLTKIKANLFGGFLADQVVLYDLKNNDKNEFLSEFDWYKSRYINEPFEPMMNNKIISEEVLKQYVNIPKNHFFKNNGYLSSKSKELTEYSDIYDFLKKEKTLFIKPFGKGGGVGVHNFKYENNKIFIDENETTKEGFISFLQKSNDWVISETISQSSFLNNIYDKTTNTIRLITARNPESGLFEIYFAVLRIGTKETIPVDNGSKGGLISKIDIESGTLSHAKSLRCLDTFDNHPDSGLAIKGKVIPGWNNIKEEMLQTARKLPYFHIIAWDILLTDDGYYVIEANNSSGVNIIQIWGGQRNGKLGDFYEAHNVIKRKGK